MLSRRGLITGLISFVAAPAIVRASSLMPVKSLDTVDGWIWSPHHNMYYKGFEIVFDPPPSAEPVYFIERRFLGCPSMRFEMIQHWHVCDENDSSSLLEQLKS